MTMRTPELEARYQADKLAGRLKNLLEEPRLWDGEHFCIIKNGYPHDVIVGDHDHDLIVLKQPNVQFWDYTIPQLRELQHIAKRQNELGKFHRLEMNFTNMQSVKTHSHWHLLELKPELR